MFIAHSALQAVYSTHQGDTMSNFVRLFLLVALVSAGSMPLTAAPKSEYWELWDAYDAADARTIDHSAYAAFLDRYLLVDDPSGVNLVRYESVSVVDRRALQAYLDYLQGVAISGYNRNEQFAYWVNLYNAATIELILEHYPVESIRDINISPGLFASGPWDAEILEVEGTALTLNDVEHRILRPLWEDPRIHYAVNCASYSCPNLAPAPYTAANFDSLLDEMASAYVNHPRGVEFDGGRLYLSSIYNWYQEDFGDSLDGVIKHLLEFAQGETARRLREHSGGARYRYDWDLNQAP